MGVVTRRLHDRHRKTGQNGGTERKNHEFPVHSTNPQWWGEKLHYPETAKLLL
jgi:hypothetical protein